MSLYYEAASLAEASGRADGSLKSNIYGAKNLKAPPAQIYALLSQALKWNSILKEILERSSMIMQERKLTPLLALLLVHDLLLAKKGIAAPAAHPLRKAVERHKARLHAELTKLRIRKGFSTIDDLREHVEMAERGQVQTDDTDQDALHPPTKIMTHPRWVRINVLRTTFESQVGSTFREYREVDTLNEILSRSSASTFQKIYYMDENIPNLLALPANTDLSHLSACQRGELIVQDKASCFPAYLLDPNLDDGDIIDACAAPGNKTTHLSAILHDLPVTSNKPRIWACERDKSRSITLQKMVTAAGSQGMVTIKSGQDFLKLDQSAEPWCRVGALLLDPSCSGSGIIGREGSIEFDLPQTDTNHGSSQSTKKRKRQVHVPSEVVPGLKTEHESLESSQDALAARLRSLSSFQAKLLIHAFKFPKARKVSYSTCSIYDEENELVVLAALGSAVAQEKGWKILKREDQVSGMKKWPMRGNREACRSFDDGDEIAEACIRCSKLTGDGTQGFFVAAFTRIILGNKSSDDDWEGFSDDGSG